MKKFEVGKMYRMELITDADSSFVYEVLKRTDKTVTVKKLYIGDTRLLNGEVKTLRILKDYSEYNKAETVMPWGKYSMCPILVSDDIFEEAC